MTSWWFQPIWKIWSSNWIISPSFGMNIKKYLSCHQLDDGERVLKLEVNKLKRKLQSLSRKSLRVGKTHWKVGSIKNGMGPNPNGPRSVSCDRAIRYSGFFGVRSVGPVGQISWIGNWMAFWGGFKLRVRLTAPVKNPGSGGQTPVGWDVHREGWECDQCIWANETVIINLNWYPIWIYLYGCFQRIMGKPPNHPFVHRVFHYFHHPFWRFSPYFWFNTHIYLHFVDLYVHIAYMDPMACNSQNCIILHQQILWLSHGWKNRYEIKNTSSFDLWLLGGWRK